MHSRLNMAGALAAIALAGVTPLGPGYIPAPKPRREMPAAQKKERSRRARSEGRSYKSRGGPREFHPDDFNHPDQRAKRAAHKAAPTPPSRDTSGQAPEGATP